MTPIIELEEHDLSDDRLIPILYEEFEESLGDSGFNQVASGKSLDLFDDYYVGFWVEDNEAKVEFATITKQDKNYQAVFACTDKDKKEKLIIFKTVIEGLSDENKLKVRYVLSTIGIKI